MCLCVFDRIKGITDDSTYKNLIVELIRMIFRHKFVLSKRKLVALSLYTLSTIYGVSTVLIPSINIINDGSKWEFLFQWDKQDALISLGYAVLAAIIIIVYLYTDRVDELSLHNEHEEIKSELLSLREDNNNNTRLLQATIKKIPRESRGLIINLLRQFKEDVNCLKLRTAFKNLIALEEQASIYIDDDSIIADIKFWQAECLRYIDSNRAIELYRSAYDSMIVSRRENKSIIEGYVYSLCASDRYSDANQIIEMYSDLLYDSDWKYVTYILSEESSDAVETITRLCETKRYNALYEILYLKHETDQRYDLISLDFQFDPSLKLTYKTLKVWLVQLSIALSRFLTTLRMPLVGANIRTNESEILLNLSNGFSHQLEDTEIRELLPDFGLYHAFVSFLHDKSYIWLEKVKAERPKCHSKIMGALFHAYILFILGDKEQGISVLEEYQKEDQSIIWNLLPVYINYNEREKIINAIESIADADFLHTMPPQIYISLFYLLKQDGRFWGTLMQKIPWGNNVNHCVFSEFIRLMSGEKEYGYKLAHIENDCPDILKFLYPTIYSEIEEYDLAIDRAKDLLPQCPTINEHTFYYIELLETAKRPADLMRYLKSLRLGGVLHPYLLGKELRLCEKVHNHIESAIIAQSLYQIDNKNPDTIIHLINNLQHAGIPNPELLRQVGLLYDYDLPKQAIQIVYGQLLLANKHFEALDFLYNQVVKSTNQDIRDMFYLVHQNPTVMSIIDSQKDVVETDDYILYSDGKSDIWDYVKIGSILEDFIGKHPEDSIALGSGKLGKKLILKAVFTKYFGLLRNVSEDITNHKSRIIRCYNFDDIKDNPLEGLKSMIEDYCGTDPQDIHSKYDDEYANGNRPLIMVRVFTDALSFAKFIWGNHRIIQIPLYEQNLKIGSIDNNALLKQKYAIDLSAIITLHLLCKQFGLKIPVKLSTTQTIFDCIVSSRDEIIISSESCIIEKSLVDAFSSVQDSNGFINELDYLDDLIDWVNNNVDIVVTDDLLNIEDNGNMLIDSHLEVVSHAIKTNKILITEDYWLQKMNRSPLSLSIECFLHCLGIKHCDVDEKLLTMNHRGHNLSSQYIGAQLHAAEIGTSNSVSEILDNFQYNPYNLTEFLNAANSMLSSVITPWRLIKIQQIFLIIFETLSYQRSKHVYQQLIALNLNPELRSCLDKAMSQMEMRTIIV